jgi:hypothetical protein
MVQRISIGAVLLVALVAAVISYCHLRDLALEHGEGWRAGLIPLSIDGMLVATTSAIVGQRRQGRPAGWVPWLGLILGIVASLLGNVAGAHSDLIARLIAAWPPVALAVAIETLVIILRGSALTVVESPAAEIAEPPVIETPAPEPKSPAKEKPVMSNAERQKAYRERKKQEKQQRLKVA